MNIRRGVDTPQNIKINSEEKLFKNTPSKYERGGTVNKVTGGVGINLGDIRRHLVNKKNSTTSGFRSNLDTTSMQKTVME